ncbi:hypothetical protein CDD82_6657 [Ophiocordyceps australis]|uniref:Transglutaminase-like domain-containing protein n=1 Tax=Ophiocordyceps australis TaxID=1399860 RepID=A0A2C5YVW0_9HYPO|nr:hypothetical protein CDD82_6657 [Ophiocordyceps australis]
MADTDQPQFSSLAERIAALNKQKSFNTTAFNSDDRKRPPPPPPPSQPKDKSNTPSSSRPLPPPLPHRNLQTATPKDDGGTNTISRAVAPLLPSRNSTAPSAHASPPLPRRTSTQSNVTAGRRNSASSLVSQNSTASSQRKLPPPNCDPATLPPLPPTRREREAKAKKSTTVNVVEVGSKRVAAPPTPSLPPRVPSRPVKSATPTEIKSADDKPTDGPRRKLPLAAIKGFGSGDPTARRSNNGSTPTPSLEGAEAPPVPLASRPSDAQIDAASARTVSKSQQPSDCWICHDWSGVDEIAAQFPRNSLPRSDVVGHLAQGLCGHFSSAADKARAIFTWCHYNIYYDTASFFNNNIRAMPVEETIFSGRAVCQGYAETYKAIAMRAGLECIVVSGHGKGFGHVPLQKGASAPPQGPDTHAWNAVWIDGHWKLVDACWGAGHIDGASKTFKRQFAPNHFTWSNDKFGLRHFPRDPRYQFRSDGRTLSWEEYYRGPFEGNSPAFYTNAHDEGIAEDSVEPRDRDIEVHSGGMVRFQFCKICEHWTSEKNGLGKPPLLLLCINGAGGGTERQIPMETNGYWHWVDVEARELGVRGQSVQVSQLTMLDGRGARGVTGQQYLSRKNTGSTSWLSFIKWELV